MKRENYRLGLIHGGKLYDFQRTDEIAHRKDGTFRPVESSLGLSDLDFIASIQRKEADLDVYKVEGSVAVALTNLAERREEFDTVADGLARATGADYICFLGTSDTLTANWGLALVHGLYAYRRKPELRVAQVPARVGED